MNLPFDKRMQEVEEFHRLNRKCDACGIAYFEHPTWKTVKVAGDNGETAGTLFLCSECCEKYNIPDNVGLQEGHNRNGCFDKYYNREPQNNIVPA